MPRPARPRPAAIAAAAGAALAAACADPIADRVTAARPPAVHGAVARAVSTPDGVESSFGWLAPTVSAPAPAPTDTFDIPALARLAVEVCALGAGDACAGAPIARYTAATVPYAQQVRADTVRQAFLVYWATGAAPAGRYRARVLDGVREVGALDVRVGATSGELAGVDRTREGAVLRGSQFALRFRVGRRTVTRPAPGDPQDTAADTTSAELLRQVAEQLYAAVDAGTDPAPGVRAVLDRLLPVLGPDRAGEVDARLASGLPLAFDFQADLVARSFGARTRTSLASFARSAAEAGATRQGGGALTLAALTDVVRPLVGRAEYGPEELVPALVLALGQARAQRAGLSTPDPVWGDGQLDALQTTLLMYALQFSGLDGVAPPATAAGARIAAQRTAVGGPRLDVAPAPGGGTGWLGGRIADLKSSGPKLLRGFVTGRIGKAVEMPLTWLQAGQTSACASVLLNSYRFALTAAPTALGRVGLGLPTTSDVDATLTFDFVPNAFGAAVLPKLGCAPPPNGPAMGRTVVWTVAGDIRAHGTVIESDGTTGAGGRARARYLTVAEDVPEGMRVLAKDATGTVDVRATGLVPGWSNLERSVGVGVQNPTDAGVRLQVRHYEWPSRVRVDFDVTLRMEGFAGAALWDVGRAGTLTLDRVERQGAVYYYGEGPARYTHFRVTDGEDGCTRAPTGTRAGTFGFQFVARDPSGQVAARSGMVTPGSVFGAERFDLVCGDMSTPTEVNGFFTGLLGVYEPLAPGLVPLRTRRAITDWASGGPGVLQATIDRRITTFAGPTTERATYRLTFEP